MPHPEGTGAGWSWMTKLSSQVEADIPEEPAGPKAKVLTVSDSVAGGMREDRSGQALVSLLQSSGFTVVETQVVPDGVVSVAAALAGLARGFAGIVVSTGGTGFAPRDQTPEATREVIEREAPGLAEAMRLCNPLGRLSRGIAGIKGQAIILNTPGSPRGAAECLGAVIDVLPHALELLGDQPTSHM
jgi:molybdopterin adenylyltransferase